MQHHAEEIPWFNEEPPNTPRREQPRPGPFPDEPDDPVIPIDPDDPEPPKPRDPDPYPRYEDAPPPRPSAD